jgi:hypothetical protein
MPRILIGRLTSAEASWDIEPEEVNGFELDPLPHSVRSENHTQDPGCLTPTHLEVAPYDNSAPVAAGAERR